METDEPSSGWRATPPISLESEPQALSVKRFAFLDSSGDGDIDSSAGAPAAGQGRQFVKSRLDLSGLLDESSDFALSPPLLAKPATARRLSEITEPVSGKDDISAPAPPPATSETAAADITKPISSLQQLARTSSHGVAGGAASKGTMGALPAANESVATTSSQVTSGPEERTTTAAATQESAAPEHAKKRATQRQQASLKKLKKGHVETPTAAAAPAVPPATATATATSAPPAQAAEPEPTSPGVEYTTVPRWTKGMKRKHGVYVSSTLVPNPAGLYERGLKGLMRAEEKRKELRAQLEEAERSANTFRPVISPRAHALKRSARLGDEATAEQVMSNQLRHRLLLLELPDEAAVTCQRSPRISTTSEKIVQKCRERSGGPAMPAGDRLYQDYFCRQDAVEVAQRQQQPSKPPALVRSKREIEAHIAALYEFEENRRTAIANAREAPLVIPSRAPEHIYIDPNDLVCRLTRQPTVSPRRLALARQEKDECTFQPQSNAQTAKLVRGARQRGLQRWVQHFCGSVTLSLPALLEYTGPAIKEAQCLAALMAQRDPAKAEWTVEELSATTAKTGSVALEQLWRRRPPGEEERFSTCGGLTFHPTLNANSAAIVESIEAEHRCGPTHDRLFLAAKSKQLSQRQRELEAEQAALEEEQCKQAKKERLQAEWRAKERRRLESCREEEARQNCAVQLLHRQAEVAPHSAPSSQGDLKARKTCRQSRLPSAPPKEPTRVRRQSSPSPTKPAGASDYATKHASAARAALYPSAPATASVHPPSLLPAEVPPSLPDSARWKDGASDADRRLADEPVATPPPIDSPKAQRDGIDEQIEVTAAAAQMDRQELCSAAMALQQLLGSTTRSSAQPTRSLTKTVPTTATPTHANPSPFMSRDINQPRANMAHCRSLDVMLECASLRDPSTVSRSERGQLERAQKRQLQELGRLLYMRSKRRVDGK
ncbi:hypothetical protein ABL78_8003 [Leptomonas seymouri]|uniref:Uncharacterized protein n=1 Tax=Leptomonas seymouri TaxID=5684 RepID=A0A0N1HRK6_LEPSE|nr:hypothetical protein ABL78_8003 [Leptomonas seymouri]|eukprot:KPI82981.1 hypothetical protein ABL78_8003 [Leptomonas seymouri]